MCVLDEIQWGFLFISQGSPFIHGRALLETTSSYWKILTFNKIFQHKVSSSKSWRQTVFRGIANFHTIASGQLLSLVLFFLYVLPLQPYPHSWSYIPPCMTTTQSPSPAWDIFWSPNCYIQLSPEYLHLNVFHIYSKYLKLGHSSPLSKYSLIFLPYFSGGYQIYTQSPSFWSLDLQICHMSLMDALFINGCSFNFNVHKNHLSGDSF